MWSNRRPPNVDNLTTFFEDMAVSLTKVTLDYENIVFVGDFNTARKMQRLSVINNISDFCDLFHLTNIVKSDTFVSKNYTSLISLINKPLSFSKTFVNKTGDSKFHKMITTIFSGLRPKILIYKDCKKFNEEKFWNHLKGQISFLMKII